MFLYPVVLSIKVRLIVISTNLENRERERQRKKEKVRRQASDAQQEKELERDSKNKGDIFCWRNNMKFCSGGAKMRNASGHLVKMSDSGKKSGKNTYNISSLKHVVVQNNGKEMYKESVLHLQSCLFAN